MRTVVIGLLSLLFVLSVFAQSRPKISELFESTGRLYLNRNGENYTAEGHWRVDQPAGKGVEIFYFEGPNSLDLFFLQRYDLHKVYEINRKTLKCNSTSVTGSMPSVWGWVAQSTYAGRIVIDGRSYDAWRFTTGGVTLGVAVQPDNADKPAYFERITHSEHYYLHFYTWFQTTPKQSWFDVPSLLFNVTFFFQELLDIRTMNSFF